MNLYPPIIPDVLPAFTENTKCKIYFSLSDYNTRNNIKHVQISITNQQTNASALKDSLSGIKIVTPILDPDVVGDYKYYIELYTTGQNQDIIVEENQFYKIQLRFSSKNPDENDYQTKEKKLREDWFYNNRNYFSEWSKVCLIKCIKVPTLKISGFEQDQGAEEDTILTNSTLNVIGNLSNLSESEYLKNYNIKIYQNSELVADSGQIYTNPYAPNEFNYEVPYNLLNGANYTLSFTYTTNNLYTETKTYNFAVVQNGFDVLNATITATPDEEKGQIKINIISNTGDNFVGNITIRRTSSKSNFHKWEDVQTFSYMTESQLNYTWYDRTIESGVWYKYCAQKRNYYGYRGIIIQIDNPVMCLFDDIFLTGGDRQLKIKFNPSLNELKYNVTESQQIALGAKYPYIKRNSANYYRTFPIGGLISSFMDTTNWYDPSFEEKDHNNEQQPNIINNNKFEQNDFKEKNKLNIFYSKNDIYEDSKQLYDQYNSNNNITEYNDYIYEREFRNKVYDFLYKYDVKLFRSTTEGNILIKLMNIDFQPVEVLGRRLYSFTATAVEIDEANIVNYDKYNIQKIGELQKEIVFSHSKLGQLYGEFKENEDIMTLIKNKQIETSDEGFINEVTSLNWIRIEIESEPQVIDKNTIGYKVNINSSDDNKYIVIPTTLERRRIIRVNGEEEVKIVHVGRYELKGDNVVITNLKFQTPVTATIDYIAIVHEKEDLSHVTQKYYYYQKVGQLYDTFKPNDAPIGQIYDKYLFNYDDSYQRLINVNGIQVESQPGAVIYVKDSNDSGFNRHVLENGYLQLMDDQVNIEGLYFCGVHLYDGGEYDQSNYNSNNKYFTYRKNEFKNIINYTDNNFLDNPVPNGVYTIDPNNENFSALDVITYNQKGGLAITYANSLFKQNNNNYSAILSSMMNSDSNKYIYYNGKWYIFTNNNDVLCPVDGIVNYYCEVMKGVYRKNEI